MSLNPAFVFWRGTHALPRRLRRAFSLAEVLLAFVVLTVAVLALTTTYPYAFGRIGERGDELQAVSFGQQYLDSVREQVHAGTTTIPSATQAIDAGYPVSSGVLNYSKSSPPPTLASPGNFCAQVVLSGNQPVACPTTTTLSTTSFASGGSGYDINVVVTWTWGGTNRQVSLETLVASEGP